MPRLKLLQLTILLSIFISISAIFIEGGGEPSFDVSSDSSDSSSSEESYGGGKGHHHKKHKHHGGGHHQNPRPPPPTRKPVAKCEDGWYMSNRTQGAWCLKVGVAQLNYQGSEAQCATFGAVLSGIQNEVEHQWINAEAIRQLVPYGTTIAGLWLGGMKVPGNIFQWNDGNTVGTEGMYWQPGQPDNAFGVDPRGPQNCMQLIILTPAFWSNPNQWRTAPNLIDDYWCNEAIDPPSRMYVCGKRATVG